MVLLLHVVSPLVGKLTTLNMLFCSASWSTEVSDEIMKASLQQFASSCVWAWVGVAAFACMPIGHWHCGAFRNFQNAASIYALIYKTHSPSPSSFSFPLSFSHPYLSLLLPPSPSSSFPCL